MEKVIDKIRSSYKENDQICIIDPSYSDSITKEFINHDFNLLIFPKKEKHIEIIKKNLLKNDDDKLKKIILNKEKFNFQNLDLYKGATLFLNLESSLNFQEYFSTYKDVIFIFYLYSVNEEDEENIRNLNLGDFKFKKKDGSILLINKKNYSKLQPFEEELTLYQEKVNEEETKMENKNWKNLTSSLFKRNNLWNEKERILKFQKYVKTVLKFLIDDEQIINTMISKEFFPIWIQSITHETYNLTENYEVLETNGDSILKFLTIQFLRKKFPNITPQLLTEYVSRYMSKEFQKNFCSQMFLETWVYLDIIEISVHIKEDLFEAFVGALLAIGNSISPQLGTMLAENFIIILLNSINFDSSMALGKPKTVLQQRGGMLGIGKVVDDEDEDGNVKRKMQTGGFSESIVKNPDGTFIYILKIDEELSNFLLLHFNRVFKGEIAREKASSKSEASENAWSKVLRELEAVGYTNEFAQKQREKLSFLNLDPDLVKNTIDKASSLGFTNLILKQARKTMKNGSVIYMLSGVDSNGKLTKLASNIGNNINDAKTKVLEKYLM